MAGAWCWQEGQVALAGDHGEPGLGQVAEQQLAVLRGTRDVFVSLPDLDGHRHLARDRIPTGLPNTR